MTEVSEDGLGTPGSHEYLGRENARAMAGRSALGLFAYPVGCLVLAATSPLSVEHPVVTVSLVVVAFVAAAGKAVLVHRFEGIYDRSPRLWEGFFLATLVASAFVWSTQGGLSVALYGVGGAGLLVVSFTAAFAAAGLRVYHPDLRVLRVHSLVLVLPLAVACAVEGSSSGRWLALAIGAVAIPYIWLEGARSHRDYRQTLGAKELADARAGELAQSEQRYRDLVEKAGVAIAVDDEEGRLRYFNERFARVFGYAMDEMRDLSHQQLVHPDDLARVQAAHRARLEGLEVSSRYEIRGVRKDGSTVSLELAAEPIWEDGRPVGTRTYLWDISERQRSEEERARLLAKLEQRRTEFAAIVDRSRDPILVVDRQGLPRFLSPAARDLLERSDPGLLDEVVRVATSGAGSPELAITRSDLSPGTGEVLATSTEWDREPAHLITVHDVSERRRAEAALRASEERHRLLFERNLAGVYRSTREGKLLDCNEAFARIFGFASREEALSRVAHDLYLDPEQRATFLAALARTGKLTNFESQGRRQDGSLLWTLENASLVSDETGGLTLIEGSLMDITDRKLMEDALRASEERQGMILGSLPVAVYTALVPSEMDAEWMSASVERLTGFPASHFTDEASFWTARIHPEDVDRATRNYRTLLSKGEAVVEYRWLHADGSYRWFSDRAVLVSPAGRDPALVTGILVDITAERQAAEALSRSERTYRGLFDGAHDPILVLDLDGQTLLDANQMACQVYGFSRAELVGLPLEAFTSDPGVELRRICAALEDPTVQGFESVHRRKGGGELWVEVNAAEVEYQGRPAVLTVNRDLTERRMLQRQLLQAQKMEAIGHLAGGVAHDFNNLLQAMLAEVSSLRPEGAGPTSPPGGVSARFEALIQRGSSLTRQLLLFARRDEAPRREVVDLNRRLRENAELLRRLVREDIELVVVASDHPLYLLANETELGQVLLNLVVNACDAMPNGGRLVLSSGRHDEDTAFFEVADTGIGIPQAIRDRIFDPFFTTKEMGRGTGLGLAVVHGIVTSHGGTVLVSGDEGRGTTFRVLLPCVGSPEQSPAPSQPGGFVRGRRERILLVEDEAMLRESLADFLTALDYTVTAAGSAAEAVELTKGPPFDLLLTDLMLPGSNGVELARDLRSRWPHLPVVLMSGYADQETLDTVATLGNARFLEKPVTMATLSQELRAAIGADRG